MCIWLPWVEVIGPIRRWWFRSFGTLGAQAKVDLSAVAILETAWYTGILDDILLSIVTCSLHIKRAQYGLIILSLLHSHQTDRHEVHLALPVYLDLGRVFAEDCYDFPVCGYCGFSGSRCDGSTGLWSEFLSVYWFFFLPLPHNEYRIRSPECNIFPLWLICSTVLVAHALPMLGPASRPRFSLVTSLLHLMREIWWAPDSICVVWCELTSTLFPLAPVPELRTYQYLYGHYLKEFPSDNHVSNTDRHSPPESHIWNELDRRRSLFVGRSKSSSHPSPDIPQSIYLSRSLKCRSCNSPMLLYQQLDRETCNINLRNFATSLFTMILGVSVWQWIIGTVMFRMF